MSNGPIYLHPMITNNESLIFEYNLETIGIGTLRHIFGQKNFELINARSNHHWFGFLSKSMFHSPS